MKKISFFITFCIFLMSNLIAQGQVLPQPPIIVQQGVQAWAYTSLDTAIKYAPTGAYVYIPGGQFGDITISKKLHLIGAGADIDSANVTGLTNLGIIVLDSCNGTTIEGICATSHGYYNQPAIAGYADSITLFKCIFRFCGWETGFLNGNNNTIKNCTIGDYLAWGACYYQTVIAYGNNNLYANNRLLASFVAIGSNNSFFNNFMKVSHFENANVANNLFYNYGYGAPFGSINGDNTMFSNNALLTYGGAPAHFDSLNCITCGYLNNIDNVISDSVFMALETTYGYPIDYHIKPNSVGHNAGLDGTDVGIYGGLYPWKEGMVPQNPQFRYQYLTPFNNMQGTIQVDIKVNAQSH